MTDPLRRRVRAKFLRALASTADKLPTSVVRAGLWPLACAARFSKFETLALDNLRIAYGDELTLAQRRTIAAGTRHHTRELIAHWLKLARSQAPEVGAGGAWIDDLVELDPSVERIDAELAKGRGCIIVTAHLGDWELLCARLRRRGYPGAVIGLKKRRDPASDWLIDMRRAYGVTTLPQDTSPRELLRVLQSGGTLGLLSDLEVRRLDGEFIPFFGRAALTMTAPAALARAHRVPLIPVRCIKPPGSTRYRLTVDEPLELDRELDRKAATIELMARVNRRFEAWIRETPEQWAWHQARWRSLPGDLESKPLRAR